MPAHQLLHWRTLQLSDLTLPKVSANELLHRSVHVTKLGTFCLIGQFNPGPWLKRLPQAQASYS